MSSPSKTAVPSSAPQPTSNREARLAKLRKIADEMAISLKGVEAPVDARDLVEAYEAEDAAPVAAAAAPAAPVPSGLKTPRAQLLQASEAPVIPMPKQGAEPAAPAPAADDSEDWVADIEHDASGKKAKKILFGSSKGKTWSADIERTEDGRPKRITFKRGKK